MSRLEEIEARVAVCPDGYDVAGVWSEWAEPTKADVRWLLAEARHLRTAFQMFVHAEMCGSRCHCDVVTIRTHDDPESA